MLMPESTGGARTASTRVGAPGPRPVGRLIASAAVMLLAPLGYAFSFYGAFATGLGIGVFSSDIVPAIGRVLWHIVAVGLATTIVGFAIALIVFLGRASAWGLVLAFGFASYAPVITLNIRSLAQFLTYGS